MALRDRDLTLTLTLRNRAVSEVNRRFNDVNRFIRSIVFGAGGVFQYDSGVGVVDAPSIVLPAGEDYPAKAKNRIRGYAPGNSPFTFDALIGTILNDRLLTLNADGNGFIASFVKMAYERGVIRAESSFNRSLTMASRKDPKLRVDSTLLSKRRNNHPVHIQRAKLAYDGVQTRLKGVTDATRSQIARVVSDGVIRGDSVGDVGNAVSNRIDKIGKVRARLIARTEIIRAHNYAAVNEAEVLQQELGVPVNMRWLTNLDGRERPSHRARNGNIYSRARAIQIIGEPNCRCAIVPWIEAFNELGIEI